MQRAWERDIEREREYTNHGTIKSFPFIAFCFVLFSPFPSVMSSPGVPRNTFWADRVLLFQVQDGAARAAVSVSGDGPSGPGSCVPRIKVA